MTVAQFAEAIKHARFVDDRVLSNAEQLAGNLGEVTPTQLRKFYNQIVSVKEQAGGPGGFERVKPQLHILKAQVTYAQARKKALVSREFASFFKISLDKVLKEGSQCLKDFTRFMEVIYAYAYVHCPD